MDKIGIFRRRVHHRTFKERMMRRLEILIKIIIMLFWPLVIGSGISLGWYEFLYKNGIHFEDGVGLIITTAWISVFGILYSLLFAIALNTVWGEYKSLRTAVKRRDIDTFMDLRDEELSPLVYVIITVISLPVLLGFMVLKYPDPLSGASIIFGVVFSLVLLFVVVMEIDDPCAGLWYIKNIPKDWLEIDPKKFRDERNGKKHLRS